MAGNSRAESVRRMVELTGLGIAATYFLDADKGAERRRAAWGLVAGRRSAHQVLAPAAVSEPAPMPAEQTAPEPEALPPATPEELVLLRSERPTSTNSTSWPSWGWAFVITITICAIAAFAAVGLGIWAIGHRTTTTHTVTTQLPGVARVLADPTARRIVGNAAKGNVILRLDSTGAALAVDGLPPLRPGTRYRVWISDGSTTTAAGGFAGRRAVLVLKPIVPGSRVTITREPAGPAPGAPRGPQVATVTVEP